MKHSITLTLFLVIFSLVLDQLGCFQEKQQESALIEKKSRTVKLNIFDIKGIILHTCFRDVIGLRWTLGNIKFTETAVSLDSLWKYQSIGVPSAKRHWHLVQCTIKSYLDWMWCFSLITPHCSFDPNNLRNKK